MSILNAICAKYGIKLGSYSKNEEIIKRVGLGHLLEYQGFTSRDGAGKPFVCYNDRAPAEEIRFTVAHELGHIFMGHTATDWTDPREAEANIFATVMVAAMMILEQVGKGDVHGKAG